MILSKDEAICLVVGLSSNQEVSSVTKLNKLLARLNLHLIPIDIDFDLNKFGSFNAHLKELETNEYYELIPYEYKNTMPTIFKLTEKGGNLFDNVVHLKLNKILTEEDFAELRDEIYELSKLKATEISDNEHKMLFVDVENRHKLIERINTVNVEMYDLFQKINEIPADNIGGLRLRALIEYCYYLTTYLRRKFKTLGDRYDFDAHMFDYYFLYHIHDMIPFLNTQFKEKNKDIKKINKYYQYIVNSVKDRYPFSLENEDLYKLIAK